MKQCLLDQNLTPHCVNCTQRKCSMGPKVLSGEKSVCAMDGQTYPSICHLRETACQRGKAIPISYRGPCKSKYKIPNLLLFARELFPRSSSTKKFL